MPKKLTDAQEEKLGDLWEANTAHEFDAILALSEALGFAAARDILARFADRVFKVGSNMPGYMPDEDPDEMDTWEDARSAVIEAIKRDADEAAEARPDEQDGDTHPIDAVRDAVLAEVDLVKHGEDFSVVFNARAYWVSVETA